MQTLKKIHAWAQMLRLPGDRLLCLRISKREKKHQNQVI